MIVLGIDTCSSVCGVALVEDKLTISQFLINIPNYHDEKLTLMVKNLFKIASLNLKDIDAISVAIGPGSFTGIRIGMSLAKGLSLAHDKPLIGVSTLDALAYKLRGLIDFFDTDKVCSVIDAKRDEIYFSIYHLKNSLERIYNYDCKTIEEFYNVINEKVIFIGDAVPKIRNYEKLKSNFFIEGDLNLNDPSIIAQIGSEKLFNNMIDDINLIEPLYIKDFNPKIKK